MAKLSTKELLREAIDSLPSGATVEDAMERLHFLAKIEKGVEQAGQGKTVSHEEAKARLGL